MKSQASSDSFPFHLFLLYILFFSGQAIYNTYLNLYLHDVGLTESQIGITVSLSTAFILITQIFWGMLSDRTKSKNKILRLLYICTALSGLTFYLGTSFMYLVVIITMFSVFFSPIVPLQDNYTLEFLEDKRWDYGQIRMGGTIGYCITVLFIGMMLKDNYRNIFLLVAFAMTGCAVLTGFLVPVQGHRNKQKKVSYRSLLRNKLLVGLILFNLAFSLGTNFFYSFYPIYFTSLGADSSMIGLMMFASAISEVPMLIFIRRIVDRLGVNKTLLFAGLVTTLRWFLLSFLRHPALIIATNLLHGVGYTCFSYCIITYIARTVPKDMRATSQTLNAVIGSVVSRVLFGYLGGIASELVGTNRIMLLSGVVMGMSTIVFAFWSANKQELSEPTGLL